MKKTFRLGAGALLLTLAGAAVAAEVPLLAELQKNLAGATNVQSEFVQEKNLALLQRSVVIRGRLAVQQPDRLSWQVLDPIRYNLVIDGSSLRQWDAESGRVQSMSLAGNPVFKVVVTQLRAWFSGQFDLLVKDFTVEADGAAATPRLVFTPRAESFAFKVIGRVVMTFQADRRYIREMVIEERSGDRTCMMFTNTILNAAVDPVAWEVKPHGR